MTKDCLNFIKGNKELETIFNGLTEDNVEEILQVAADYSKTLHKEAESLNVIVNKKYKRVPFKKDEVMEKRAKVHKDFDNKVEEINKIESKEIKDAPKKQTRKTGDDAAKDVQKTKEKPKAKEKDGKRDSDAGKKNALRRIEKMGDRATLWTAFRSAVQDYMYRVKRMQRALERAGIKVTEDMNAYLHETLMNGKAMHKILWAEKKIYDRKNPNSLISRMKKAGIAYKQLGEFMTARHAQERNAKMYYDLKSMRDIINDKDFPQRSELLKDIRRKFDVKKLDDILAVIDERLKGLEDGTSAVYGMSDTQSAKILEKAERDGTFDKMSELADFYKREVTDWQLEVERDAGMLSQASYERLMNTYKNYVPLLVEEHDDIPSYASKIGDAYSSIKHIKGSGLEKTRRNPIEAGFETFKKSAINSEKNKAMITFKNLVEKGFGSTKIAEVIPSGEFHNMAQSAKNRSISVTVDGEKMYILINNQDLLNTLKKVGANQDLNLILSKVIAPVNNWMRGVLTQYNPAFQLPNYVRDMQQAYFNLPQEVKSKVSEAEFMAMSAKSLKGIHNYKVNFKKGKHATSKEGKAYEQLLAHGGVSRWGVQIDPKKTRKNIEAEFKKMEEGDIKNIMLQALDGISDATLGKLDNIGEYAEHANRLAVFMAAKKGGKTTNEAAFLAKESTINFDRKGSFGGVINTLYLFSNAGIQGSARMLHTMRENPLSAAKFLTKVVGFSAIAMQSIYMLGLGDEYEDEPEWSKLHNIYLPFYDLSNKKPMLVKIPAPYGLNFFPYIGQAGVSMAHNYNDDRLDDSLSALVQAGSEIINPMGTGLSNLTPTFLKPFGDVVLNKNFMDSPIRYEDTFSNMDAVLSEHGRHATGQGYKEFARMVNAASGGSKTEKGAFDRAPEDYRHIVEGYGGGIYKEMKNAANMITGEADAEFPIVRRFLPSTSKNAATRRFNEYYTEAGGEIFEAEKWVRVRKDFHKAVEEGYLDVEMLENMLKRMLNTQAIKMGAASQDMSEREFTGKETEAEARAKIREDTKKKNKKN